jgi:hypothetical protein
MTEDDRLANLAAGVISDAGYLSGRRRYPRTVTADDAVALAGRLQERVDAGCRERARAVERAGAKIACHDGCNACCEHPVMVYRPEAERIARWLALPENASAREAFLAAYPAWRAKIVDCAPLAEATAAGTSQAAIEAAHRELWQRRALCAFNHDGRCVIYPVRPMLCRDCHALDTETHCRVDDDSGVPVRSYVFVPLAELVRTSRSVLIGLHNAIGAPARRPESVCDAVHELIQR